MLIGLLLYIAIFIIMAKTLWSGYRATQLKPVSGIKIGIGLTITSVGVTLEPENGLFDIKQFSFLHTVVPSFCKTASSDYDYVFYLAYDYDDVVFSSLQHRTKFLG